MSKPKVAIVGRPNVGKSTLVNRIIGRREAIVEEKPGVTRDRKVVDAEWNGREFHVIDTGGWMPFTSGNDLDGKVSKQSEMAVREADVVVMVVDAEIGLTDEDESVAQWLRACGRPVVLAVNKVDNERRALDIWDFMTLGLGDPWGISALHGRGAGDFLDEVLSKFHPDAGIIVEEIVTTKDKTPAIAIVGRPNVGKSTLFNRLIGEDRSVVHDMPGTTRDSVDTIVQTPDGPIKFIDTAGMRRKSRVDEGTEFFSTLRALSSVDNADIALLVIDGQEGITHQDQRLAERVDAAGCPIVVVLNKWELLDEEAKADVAAQVGDRLAFVGDSPVIRISALSGMGVHRLLPIISGAMEDYRKRVPTREVNKCIALAQQQTPAPAGARILYATQGATDPPTFTLFANRELPATYLRYIERSLREQLKFGATPIKLRVRLRSN